MDEIDILNMFWRLIRWVKNIKVFIISIVNMFWFIFLVLGIVFVEEYLEKRMIIEIKDKNFF